MPLIRLWWHYFYCYYFYFYDYFDNKYGGLRNRSLLLPEPRLSKLDVTRLTDQIPFSPACHRLSSGPATPFALCAQLRLHGSTRKCGSTRGFVRASILYYIPRVLLWAKPSHFPTISLDTSSRNEMLAHFLFLGPTPGRIYRFDRRARSLGRSSMAISTSRF